MVSKLLSGLSGTEKLGYSAITLAFLAVLYFDAEMFANLKAYFLLIFLLLLLTSLSVLSRLNIIEALEFAPRKKK